MQLSDTIILAGGERFAVGLSTLTAYHDRPERIDGGTIMICRRGTALLVVNVRTFELREGSQIFMLPGNILTTENASPDFEVEYVHFSREMFEEASFRMDHAFFRFLSDNPFYQHNETTLAHLERWLSSVQRMYDDRAHMFRDTIVRNQLQNIFLNAYDTLRRRNVSVTDEHTGRQGELFHKYISLVRDNFREQHNVSFYAAQMFITTRYLSTIVRNLSGDSPKDVIDRMLVLEMKMMLRSSNLSVQEIASRLHFPDQSYMGRYFRKHTGQSPTEYRNRR